MRVLLVGAGGVGTAITRIAARHSFFDHMVVTDYRLSRVRAAVAALGREAAPRDVVAACLPDPASPGELRRGKTCAGTWVKGTEDGAPRIPVGPARAGTAGPSPARRKTIERFSGDDVENPYPAPSP